LVQHAGLILAFKLGDLNSLYSILHHAPTTWFGSWFSSGMLCGGAII